MIKNEYIGPVLTDGYGYKKKVDNETIIPRDYSYTWKGYKTRSHKMGGKRYCGKGESEKYDPVKVGW